MIEVWIKSGEYGTPSPFLVSSGFFVSKEDPVLRGCIDAFMSLINDEPDEKKGPVEVVIKTCYIEDNEQVPF